MIIRVDEQNVWSPGGGERSNLTTKIEPEITYQASQSVSFLLGVTLEQIADFIMSLTASQVARSDFTIPPGRENELVYQTAFPSRLFGELPCFPAPPPSC